MYTKATQEEIGRRLRELRRRQDLTQENFAKRLQLSANFLSEIENGKKGMSCETLYNLCETLKLSPDELLFGGGSAKDASPASLARLAADMNQNELSALIEYLKSLKNFQEQLACEKGA